MLENNNGAAAVSAEVKHKRSWKDSSFGVVAVQFARNKTALVGLILILLLIIMGLLAPMIAPCDYSLPNPRIANATPSAEHLLGCDKYGRDILSRVMWGARTSMGLGIGASLLGVIVGVIFGAIAGFFGGWVEGLILRACDVIQSIPNMLLCILISQMLGTGIFTTMVALAFYSIPEIVRLLRSAMMSLRDQEFIEACKAINCSKIRILMVHMLPNSLSSVIVSFSIGVGMKIMNSAGLSFLGLGIQEPTPEWGAMISLAKETWRLAPHTIIIPGIFVAVVVLAFNFVGDGLRDALDPRLRK